MILDRIRAEIWQNSLPGKDDEKECEGKDSAKDGRGLIGLKGIEIKSERRMVGQKGCDKIGYKSKIINSKLTNKKMQYMDVLLSYTQSSDPQQTFQLLDILGQGAYGSVSKALHKQTGELYAIKILPATSVNEISVIKKQIAILRECNDEHIVKYYGSYFKDNNLWIVMEYCMAGSVTDIVNITGIELNEGQIASILELVLKGLKYLHDRKKIHRDIKAANILLDQNGTAKLADFGVSTQMMYTNARHNTHIGSPYWMSPEVIKYSEYNQKTDIWSLGVTAIQLAEGVVPYSHLKPFMAMWTMKDKPIQGFKEPENWSAEFSSFVQLCLKINPDERPNAEDLLHHDFIRKNSKGKRLLAELVHNSMGEIENFRAGQGPKEELDRNELKEMIFSKGDSNGSEYESKTVIVKGSEKKGSEVDSVIEHSGDSGCFKKQESEGSSHNKLLYGDDEQEEDSGSVIVKDAANEDKGHSRNCSEISVSSVLVKSGNQDQSSKGRGSVAKDKGKEETNFFKSYVQKMQAMQSKQEEFKQSVQDKIHQIEELFLRQVREDYAKAKGRLRQFFIDDRLGDKKLANANVQQKPAKAFSSKLYESQSLLQFLYNNPTFTAQKQQLEQDFKEKYLSNIQPVENNYISMMLESGNDEGSGEYNHNLMQFINDDRDSQTSPHDHSDHSKSNGTFLKHSGQLNDEFRKKSQSSADSPTAIFHNKKKNLKKLIIQETLEDTNHDHLLNRDTTSVDTEGNYTHHNHSLDKHPKQSSSLSKFLEKTPTIANNNPSKTNTKYKEVFLNSANFTNNNKSLLMSTGNYPHSTTTNLRNQKRVITTEPHQAYEYETDSLSTLTKLHTRNLKQFYDDPVVMNNLKQLTQGSEEYHGVQLNPFELKKNSFSKEIKSVKSKDKDANKINILREKQRATHIAHIAMAHNNRTITNSNKKIKVVKVIEEREKTPEDLNNESTKTTKAKKSKSKNKQTASTTIPFGSVGNMGALEFLPNKVGKSKEKKPSQIPVKSGPFSKIKNKN